MLVLSGKEILAKTHCYTGFANGTVAQNNDRWWLSGCVAIYANVDSHDLLPPPSLDVLICVLGLRVLAGGVGFEGELLGATVAA